MTTISIVTPVYACGAILATLHQRLVEALTPVTQDFEIIMVNDASPDSAWATIKEICAQDSRVKGVSLSRNFGQHPAIMAGLSQATGEWIVVMDCDMQDAPEEIPRFFEKALQGYDLVLGKRAMRKDSWIKRQSSIQFYKLLSYLTETHLDPGIANFGIYHRKVIEAILEMGDPIRFFPAMAQWVGFKSATIDVEHGERFGGSSSYSWRSLFKLASNVIITFSNKPLRIIINAGFLVSALALVYAAYIVWKVLVIGSPVPGWSSVIVSVWFLSGLHIVVAGIVGVYVGKVFDASKKRPIYIFDETINLTGKKQ